MNADVNGYQHLLLSESANTAHASALVDRRRLIGATHCVALITQLPRASESLHSTLTWHDTQPPPQTHAPTCMR